jgi:hypothetical protein
MTNDGTIDSDAGGTITVGTVASWTNNGTLRASVTGSAIIWEARGRNDGHRARAGAARSTRRRVHPKRGGELQVDIKGTATSDFGKATVTNAATLGRHAHDRPHERIRPEHRRHVPDHDVRHDDRSFSTINGITIGGGKKFDVNVGATDITLEGRRGMRTRRGGKRMAMKATVVAEGLEFPEGPTWLGPKRVAVTQIRGQCVSLWENGRLTKIADTGGGANGATLGADGRST